ncbi:MAG TPA: hypothetical protein VD906_12400 [Caulobacteraceae bacterium]|nr:hypothetical protein [Caulobacteraceae bacterium]
MLAKCGPRVIAHWAHWGRRQCDPWWENETSWHRGWKALFPQDWVEVLHTAADGEVHRADIKTPRGIVIEVQHSAMSDAERMSRETFYGNMIWIVDGSPFRSNFDIYHPLPDPNSELAGDLIWLKGTRQMQGAARGLFIRLSECLRENPSATKEDVRGGYLHGIAEIRGQLDDAYVGHHQYDWVRPRRTWLESGRPVFIDMGGGILARLALYDSYRLPCVQLLRQADVVRDLMSLSDARQVGQHGLAIGASY